MFNFEQALEAAKSLAAAHQSNLIGPPRETDTALFWAWGDGSDPILDTRPDTGLIMVDKVTGVASFTELARL